MTHNRPQRILGTKLRQLRKAQGLPQKVLAQRAEVSSSYLSEIEQGKKYPSPKLLLRLAEALGVTYDALVTLSEATPGTPATPGRVDSGVHDSGMDMSFLEAIPFAHFGVEPAEVARLVAAAPDQVEALVRTFADIMRHYDLRVEHFLFAALRSYQQLHGNYFPDLETAAETFRTAQGWSLDDVPTHDELRAVLTTQHGYQIDDTTLSDYADLSRLRSVYYPHPESPRLFVNPQLMASQQAFIYAREIGYSVLGITERPHTSTYVEVSSFEQVLNHFKASYFGGAVLMPRATICNDLAAFFDQPIWSSEALREAFSRYNATPEMVYYRLCELIPKFFGLGEIYFMRFYHQPGTDVFKLTKVFNMSHVPVPHGISAEEHYCRRWVAVRALKALADGGPSPVIQAQRVRFHNDNAAFFAMAVARPLVLKPGVNSVVSLGFRMDDQFRETVRFWDDPAVPLAEVNLTCERCPLLDCLERAAPPTILHHSDRQLRQQVALEKLGRSLR